MSLQTASEIDDRIAELYRCEQDGDWTTSLVDHVRECFNCSHAEVHPDGSVYIEDPQTGHYLQADELKRLDAFFERCGLYKSYDE